jgi:hypothetical protein
MTARICLALLGDWPPGQGTSEQTGNGSVFRTWHLIGGKAHVVFADKQAWYGFKGAWGDPRKAWFAGYGPAGPGAQSGSPPAGW